VPFAIVNIYKMGPVAHKSYCGQNCYVCCAIFSYVKEFWYFLCLQDVLIVTKLWNLDLFKPLIVVSLIDLTARRSKKSNLQNICIRIHQISSNYFFSNMKMSLWNFLLEIFKYFLWHNLSFHSKLPACL